jgi:hypothetical protein
LKEVLHVCPDCGETATPGIFEKKRIKCKKTNCGRLATIRKCPKCFNKIPRTVLESPNFPISVIGVSCSGKTSYVTVMLQELGQTPNLCLTLAAQNNYTDNHQNEKYKLLYNQHVPPESTPPTAIDTNLTPQIWRIKNNSKKRGITVPAYTFTIYDGSGEDHEHKIDPKSPVCRYIAMSKAIILLIDPLILSSVRKSGFIDPEVMRNSLAGRDAEYKNTVHIVSNVASYINEAYGIGEGRILNIPVAVVLAKFDAIKEHKAFTNALVKSDSSIFRNGKVSINEIKQVDEDIRIWLDAIGESSLIHEIESNFKNFYFFGVSSLGDPPTGTATLSEHIKPHRVLDPILWLLKIAKFID